MLVAAGRLWRLPSQPSPFVFCDLIHWLVGITLHQGGINVKVGFPAFKVEGLEYLWTRGKVFFFFFWRLVLICSDRSGILILAVAVQCHQFVLGRPSRNEEGIYPLIIWPWHYLVAIYHQQQSTSPSCIIFDITIMFITRTTIPRYPEYPTGCLMLFIFMLPEGAFNRHPTGRLYFSHSLQNKNIIFQAWSPFGTHGTLHGRIGIAGLSWSYTWDSLDIGSYSF